MKETNYEEILEILKKNDTEKFFGEFTDVEVDKKLIEDLKGYFNKQKYKYNAVLGIDIYKYSKFREIEQNLIPIVFKYLYQKAIDHCKECEEYLFQKYDKDLIAKNLIHRGDGGFQVFPTPLHALVFAIYFETILKTYNSYHYFPKLRKLIGEINLRYALTYDKLFNFDNNYFGPAIINNARILSRDSLNRFLIDGNAYSWFLNKTTGIETLKVSTYQTISKISEFKDYDKNKFEEYERKNLVFKTTNTTTGENNLEVVNVLKIGMIKSKETEIDVYNLFLQLTLLFYHEEDEKLKKPIVISIGNLNTAGIS